MDSEKNSSLSFVHITVFEADELYEQGLMRSVVEHEPVHALGPQHSSFRGIMYPSRTINDDKPLTAIGKCEYDAIRTLRRIEDLQGPVQTCPCMSSNANFQHSYKKSGPAN
jgi:hypothetical protein